MDTYSSINWFVTLWNAFQPLSSPYMKTKSVNLWSSINKYKCHLAVNKLQWSQLSGCWKAKIFWNYIAWDCIPLRYSFVHKASCCGCLFISFLYISLFRRFNDILLKCRLQKRGTGGVDTASNDGTFDISNLDRLGKSEVDLVQLVIDGVDLLVEMEKKLEKGKLVYTCI